MERENVQRQAETSSRRRGVPNTAESTEGSLNQPEVDFGAGNGLPLNISMLHLQNAHSPPLFRSESKKKTNSFIIMCFLNIPHAHGDPAAI